MGETVEEKKKRVQAAWIAKNAVTNVEPEESTRAALTGTKAGKRYSIAGKAARTSVVAKAAASNKVSGATAARASGSAGKLF